MFRENVISTMINDTSQQTHKQAQTVQQPLKLSTVKAYKTLLNKEVEQFSNLDW